MKQNVSPAIVVAVIAVVVAVAALLVWHGAKGGAGNPDQINKTIAAGVAGGQGGLIAPPPGIGPRPGGAGTTGTLGTPPPGVGTGLGTPPPGVGGNLGAPPPGVGGK